MVCKTSVKLNNLILFGLVSFEPPISYIYQVLEGLSACGNHLIVEDRSIVVRKFHKSIIIRMSLFFLCVYSFVLIFHLFHLIFFHYYCDWLAINDQISSEEVIGWPLVMEISSTYSSARKIKNNGWRSSLNLHLLILHLRWVHWNHWASPL